MQFQGERTFSLPQTFLFSRLSDASFLVGCIPDATMADTPSVDEAKCSVRPNLGFVRGSLDVVLTVMSRQPESALAFRIANKGIGSSANVDVSLTLTPADGSTKVDWTAAVTLGGLLKAVPSGLIRGAAKVIDDIWAGIDAKLADVG